MAQNMTVCIARQFGSGGREIGLALANALGVPFYDKELLRAAAEKSGILQELFEQHDEKPTRGIQAGALMADAGGKAASYDDYLAYLPNDRLQSVLAEVIREVAERSSCVIIGRCADYILRGRAGTLSAFVYAAQDTRVQRVARLHNLDEDAARALIRKTDRGRANYYGYYTDRDWGLAENYDLSLDAGRLGVEKAAYLLQKAAPLYCG